MELDETRVTRRCPHDPAIKPVILKMGRFCYTGMFIEVRMVACFTLHCGVVKLMYVIHFFVNPYTMIKTILGLVLAAARTTSPTTKEPGMVPSSTQLMYR